MKKEILGLLLKNKGEYVSGEQISKTLEVSRAAIWKHIKSLQSAGYIIDAVPRKGYVLRVLPDIINAEEIKLGITTKILGSEVYVYDELESTNKTAKEMAEENKPEGTIVIAEQQLQGKGRLGRTWVSPKGTGLWFSIILRPRIKPFNAPQLIFVSAVGVCRAIRQATGQNVAIKWPNDILYENKKICGILTELSAEIDIVNHVVVGIGINVYDKISEVAPELTEIAAALCSIKDGIRRKELLLNILEEIEVEYIKYLNEGFSGVLNSWRALNCTLGKEINVISQDENYSGLAEDIDKDGCLLVRTASGELRAVIVGDVSIRPQQSFKES